MDKHNVKLPIWVLTPNEEKEARKRWKDHAYKECDEFVKKFADCSKQNGLKVIFNCHGAKNEMNKCILKLQDPEELDKQRRILIVEKKEKMKAENAAN